MYGLSEVALIYTWLKSKMEKRISQAVSHFWTTRFAQAERQEKLGRSDQGARSAVTGGAQMDGFIELITEIITNSGIQEVFVHRKKRLVLPGFFRPTKEWDLLVIQDDQLVAALELKSHVGPSFGNNFNNRTEEAMGSALDLWTAYREGALNKTIKPWLGFMLLLEDCDGSRSPVKVKEPHFKVLPEFRDASYAMRYELFCRKLVRERHYNSAAFLLTNRDNGQSGDYEEPAPDLNFESFAKSLVAQVAAYSA